MRVLGDVDAAPEIDTLILDVLPGDRWLLCSDGLSSYVDEDRIGSILATIRTAQGAADRLVKESLDHGAPDNVTVVLVDIDDSGGASGGQTMFVGAASMPLSFDSDTARRPIRLPTLLLHPLKSSQSDDSHFEPESEGYLDELIEEDRRRVRRRRIVWLSVIIVAVVALITAGFVAYQWTQSHYFVGEDQGKVVIFQGVQQNIGPISLSSVYQTTQIEVDELPMFQRDAVEATISADSLRDAMDIVDRLAVAAEQ
jgi:PPM family protein phosphatase